MQSLASQPHRAHATGSPHRAEPIAVYVHFPWCLRKCPYCDFVSYEKRAEDIDHRGYTEALLAEIEHRRGALADRALESVFFGGGTPSLWDPVQLGRVLRGVLGAAGTRSEDLEVTVECNPSSLDPTRARALADQGVARLSVGVQSLDARRLSFLGRLHAPDEGLAAVEAALSAVPRVSADLIHGVHGSRPAEDAEHVRRVAALGVRHLSAYALTIEPQTRFGELARSGRLPLLEDDVLADSFEAVGEALEPLGLRRYETSSFAVPGEESRHNLAYWQGRDYLGLGCAAFGTLSRSDGSAVRYRNAPNVDKYLKRVDEGRFEPHEREILDPETRLRERLMLGLRLRSGLDLEAAATSLGVEPWPPRRAEAAERLLAEGRLKRDGGRLWLPPEAWLHADGIAAALF